MVHIYKHLFIFFNIATNICNCADNIKNRPHKCYICRRNYNFAITHFIFIFFHFTHSSWGSCALPQTPLAVSHSRMGVWIIKNKNYTY